jgi:hypothetical protein
MIKKSLFVLAMLAAPTAAFAQDDTTGGGGGGDGSGSAATAGGTAGAAAGGQMEAMGSSPAIFKHGTMGLSFPVSLAFNFTVNTGAATTPPPPVTPIDLLYFNDANTAYDLILGFNLSHLSTTDAMGNTVSATTFGATVGAGIRMYKHHSARIHTFLEPAVVLHSDDLGSIGDNLTLGVGGSVGVEAMLTEWFSLSGQVGAELDFANKFKNITFDTVRTGLFANFYWD